MTNSAVPSLALVVEDDQLQRKILSDTLKDENMDVIQCESAEAAELVIARVGAELRLLVTDVKLAGPASGIALAEFAQQNFPGLIIVVSGEDELVLPLQFRFLKKPYRPSDVLRLVAF
jgi:DNA-binding NtrC family response regulator